MLTLTVLLLPVLLTLRWWLRRPLSPTDNRCTAVDLSARYADDHDCGLLWSDLLLAAKRAA